MIVISSYKIGKKHYCKVRNTEDKVEVEQVGKSFFMTFLVCFFKMLLLDLKLKIKKLREV